MKFDSTGNPIIIKIIDSTRSRFNEMQMTSNGILLLSHSPNNPEQYNTGIYRDERTTLIKLDFDLNFVWGKQYYGEDFPYYSAGIKPKPNGNLLMSHSTFGAYPAVLTELDEFGNVLSQKGYPNYEPQVAVLNDGSLLMTSKFSYDDNGQTFYQPVIAKTDTTGVIEGCVNYPSCILAEDFVVEFGTFNYDTVSIPDLEGFDTLVSTDNFSFSEFCGFPPFPLPDFNFPDTLCLGKSSGTSNTSNILANAREWHLIGPQVDSTLKDSFNFSYTFEHPGEYLLTQTVWVLGCPYQFERNITVLTPLEVSFTGDTLICPGEPLTIHAEADRPATFSWSNGQSGSTIGIATSGTYAVTATDGHCFGGGSTAVTTVAELLGGQPPFTLPHDTVTCLPLILVPQSAFTSQFYTSTAPTSAAASFTLDKAGRYRIGATVFGCEFWETFEYSMDCHVDVYLPTSFSPNGDGINDEFMPYGNNFEVLDMWVYDRWGGLIHHGKEWDGGKANQGLYVYELSYLNLRSGLKETQFGEVQLVR
ncbi:MAG: gliding motility-associated C-terminal domain-containing protein [Saprospiraceae bacterium]|nr:gliding motility-associated C-terminal domain-containing protein [Saprospiraceae bacterium]